MESEAGVWANPAIKQDAEKYELAKMVLRHVEYGGGIRALDSQTAPQQPAACHLQDRDLRSGMPQHHARCAGPRPVACVACLVADRGSPQAWTELRRPVVARRCLGAEKSGLIELCGSPRGAIAHAIFEHAPTD